MSEKEIINITPEMRADQLLEWFMEDANMDDYARTKACLYAAKCAFEIKATHHPSTFEFKFYLSVENILRKKYSSL